VVDGLAVGTMNVAAHLPGAATAIRSARSTPARLSRARRSHRMCTLAGFGEPSSRRLSVASPRGENANRVWPSTSGLNSNVITPKPHTLAPTRPSPRVARPTTSGNPLAKLEGHGQCTSALLRRGVLYAVALGLIFQSWSPSWLCARPSHRPLAEPRPWELPLTYEGRESSRYAMPFRPDALGSSLLAGSAERACR
jgi:hypothetical protein